MIYFYFNFSCIVKQNQINITISVVSWTMLHDTICPSRRRKERLSIVESLVKLSRLLLLIRLHILTAAHRAKLDSPSPHPGGANNIHNILLSATKMNDVTLLPKFE